MPEDTDMIVTIDHLYSDLIRINGKCLNIKVSLSYQGNTVVEICGSHHNFHFVWSYPEIEVSVEFVILYVPYYLIISYGLCRKEKPGMSIPVAYDKCLQNCQVTIKEYYFIDILTRPGNYIKFKEMHTHHLVLIGSAYQSGYIYKLVNNFKDEYFTVRYFRCYIQLNQNNLTYGTDNQIRYEAIDMYYKTIIVDSTTKKILHIANNYKDHHFYQMFAFACSGKY